ncbi:MAG: hypothetical protein P8Z49_09110, partial [Acidobacteriota bacterium]
MAEFKNISVPSDGNPITMEGGTLNVPDHPILPFIEGDGTGPDIWRASKRVLERLLQGRMPHEPVVPAGRQQVVD